MRISKMASNLFFIPRKLEKLETFVNSLFQFYIYYVVS